MIKGSTKVGEIFLCGPETEGKLEVLNQFLGKAITGLGGGCKRMYVLEEGDSFVAIQPRQQGPLTRPGTEEERPSGRKYQALSHQKFGMTPFDQQQNTHNTHLQNPLAHVDQKIEERESLRHSTHRSQRSDRAPGTLGGAGGPISGPGAASNNQVQAQQQQIPTNQMHQTASDRFGQTDQNFSENQDRPAFQRASNQYNIDGEQNEEEQRFAQEQQEILHQQHIEKQMQQQDHDGQKMFSFEDDQKNAQLPEAQRQQLQTQQNILAEAPRTQNAEKMGHLQQINCGRDHTLNLTRDGDVFSYGSGQFSAAGHGGSKEVLTPMILKPLRDKRVIKIACGESHSLVLTDKSDVYAWGRGFEGQLGLSASIEVASTPQYIKSFYGMPVQTIEAGAYFSLAITKEGYLYGWGEAKMGQLGNGKGQREVRRPQRIPICREGTDQEQQVVSCSAGFGHSACLTESGELYTWGFNIYGQLGLGDKATRWIPEKVSRDISNHNMARQIKVKCSNYATFSIDEYGHPYSWGKGYLGHCGNSILELPKMIETNTDNRIFTDMFSNDDSILFYAPIRVYNITPACGPSKGNTAISITGTGFVNSEKLRVRFTYGDLSQEVQCLFDEQSQSLVCQTPKFEEFDGEKHPSVQLPCDCYLSVTMDGINYSECEMPFKIYSNEINLTSLNPKSGSVKGGSEVTLFIDLDEVTASSIQNLTVGFQPRSKKQSKGPTGNPSSNNVDKPSRQSLNESSQRGSRANITAGFDDYQKNAGDGSELANWTCSDGVYEDGKIICKVPQLKEGQYNPDGNLQYNVDVALNGQQFTGRPLVFRYYDIRLEKIEPPLAQSEGGASILILGKGIYDSAIKKVKFVCAEGEREVTAEWDKKSKCLKCIVPPLSWLWGGEEIAEEKVAAVKANPIKILLTFNNQEWIAGPDFKYHDHTVSRIAYAHNYMGEAAEPEVREAEWLAEQPEEELPEEITEEEIAKRDEEKLKVAEAETEESTTVSKRKSYRLFVHGTGFLKSDEVTAKFTWEPAKDAENPGPGVARSSPCVYKNDTMLGTSIPDMGAEVPEGEHLISVEISLNGQQYSNQNIQFFYKSVDPNLTEEELKALDAEDAKGAKKPAGKKK